MKIAVISDIHDDLEKLKFVLSEVEAMGIDTIICCGDLCAPFVGKCLAEDFKGDVYTVFGNTADRENTPKLNQKYDNFNHMGDVGEVELGNHRIGWVHYPEIAEEMAKSGVYDFVFHGHTHLKRAEMFGDCLLLNPGEIRGYRYPPHYAIVDLETKEYNFIPL